MTLQNAGDGGKAGGWCYVDEAVVDLPDRASAARTGTAVRMTKDASWPPFRSFAEHRYLHPQRGGDPMACFRWANSAVTLAEVLRLRG